MKPSQCFVQERNVPHWNSIKTGVFGSLFCVDRAHTHLGSEITGQDTASYVEAVSSTPTKKNESKSRNFFIQCRYYNSDTTLF